MRDRHPVIALSLLSACTTTAPPRMAGVRPAIARASRTLSGAEIQQRFGPGTLLDAIQRLRPLLAPRGIEQPSSSWAASTSQEATPRSRASRPIR